VSPQTTDIVGRYRKLPVEIEAAHLTDDADWKAIAIWCSSPLKWAHRRGDLKDQLPISTPEGTIWVSVGDWIIKGVKGEFYRCKPDIFEAAYEPTPTQNSEYVCRFCGDPVSVQAGEWGHTQLIGNQLRFWCIASDDLRRVESVPTNGRDRGV
jgi:hypothetical protein